MDMSHRYVMAVRRYLPKAQADDIAAELSDSIETRLEARSAELGRPLHAEEEAALLKTYGHPLLAASRYWPQQALIGPQLLPFWWLTLKTAIIILLSINLAIDLVVVVAGQDAASAFGIFWGTVWGTTIFTFAIVTLVFALLERFGRFDDIVRWDPRSLPEPEPHAIPRYQSGIELFANGIFALWVSGLPALRELAAVTPLGPGIRYILGLPVRLDWLHQFLVVLLVTAIAQAVMSAATLARPDWWRLRAAVYACTNSAVFVLCAFTLAVDAHALVVPGAGPSPVGDVARVAMILNWIAAGLLASMCVGCGITVVMNVMQLLPRRSTMNAGRSLSTSP